MQLQHRHFGQRKRDRQQCTVDPWSRVSLLKYLYIFKSKYVLHSPSAGSRSCPRIVRSHRTLFLYLCPPFAQIMLSVPLRHVLLQGSVSGLTATSLPRLIFFHFISLFQSQPVCFNHSQQDCRIITGCPWAFSAGKSLLGHTVKPSGDYNWSSHFQPI